MPGPPLLSRLGQSQIVGLINFEQSQLIFCAAVMRQSVFLAQQIALEKHMLNMKLACYSSNTCSLERISE
jgi:hypothetical protein